MKEHGRTRINKSRKWQWHTCDKMFRMFLWRTCMYFITFFMTVTLTCGAIAWQHKVCLFPWVHCLKLLAVSTLLRIVGLFSHFLHVCSFEMLKFSITSPSLIVCFLIWYFFKSNHIFKKAEKYNIEMHTGLFFLFCWLNTCI